MQNMHILIAEIGQSGSGLPRQLTDPLNRVDVPGNFSEHGCRIARSGSDLEHLLTASQRQRLRHEGDNVRLGNCLTRFDRQRSVLVGKLMQLLRQECLTRDLAHCVENQFGAHAPRKNCLFYHFMAKIPKVPRKMNSHALALFPEIMSPNDGTMD